MRARTRPAISLGVLFGCLLVAVLFASSCSDASENSVSAPAATATDNTVSSGTDTAVDIPSDSTSTPPGSPGPSGASPTTTEQSTTTAAPAPTTSPPTTTISTTTTTTTTTLPPVTPDFEPGEFDFSLSVGSSHACILLETGNITCWGANDWGQLGNGETSDYIDLVEYAEIEIPCSGSDCDGLSLMEQISFGSAAIESIGDATDIAAGSNHTCALHTDGTVSCWGYNRSGQLGNGKSGDNEFSAQPIKIPGIADATAIDTGGWHNCALHADGTVSCWGYNDDGQLGNGESGDRDFSSPPVFSPTPGKVLNITNATAIATGRDHSCALLADRTVSCWGNFHMGYDWYVDINKEPVKIDDVNDAIKIVAGSFHTCALHTDGTVTCWGDDNYGQLEGLYDLTPGDPEHSPISFAKPEFFAADHGLGVDIAAGDLHTCVLRKYGGVYCWGKNWNGQLGIGEPFLNSMSAASGDVALDFSFEIEYPYSLYPYSLSTYSRELDNSYPPRQAIGINDAIAILADENLSCALHEDSTVSCWGYNYFQSLSKGRIRASAVPVKAHNINNAVSVVTGLDHTCALHENNTASCWGNSRQGKLGNPIFVALGKSPAIAYRVEGAVSITSNNKFTCVLHQSGHISCWGNNWAGQLGNGAYGWGEFLPDQFSGEPVYANGISDAIQVAAGGHHTCALHQDNTVSCWGYNRYGQLGNGEANFEVNDYYAFQVEVEPVRVIGITDAIEISAGSFHTCALHPDETISCWGNDEDGQLGDGISDYQINDDDPLWLNRAIMSTPVKVKGITNAKAIASGARHSCALHNNATVSCWGKNKSRQLGDGTTTSSNAPIKVLGIADVKAIAAGHEHTCALHTDGTVSCWGSSNFGKLGSGEMKVRESSLINEALEPVRVKNITNAVAIAAGGQHTCAIHEDGTVSCWGSNISGQLGEGFVTNSALPIQLETTFETSEP